MAKKTRLPDTPQQAMLRQITGELAKDIKTEADLNNVLNQFMVRKLNRLLLGFLTMNCGKEEPHMVRTVAE